MLTFSIPKLTKIFFWYEKIPSYHTASYKDTKLNFTLYRGRSGLIFTGSGRALALYLGKGFCGIENFTKQSGLSWARAWALLNK
jgi:hypothetical protein